MTWVDRALTEIIDGFWRVATVTSAGKPVVRVRSGRGETMRAEFLGQEGDKVHVRYLKEVDGRTPESWIHVKRIIGELPGGQVGREA